MKSLIQRVWGQGEGTCMNPLTGQAFPLTPTLPLRGGEGEALARLVAFSSIPRTPQYFTLHDARVLSNRVEGHAKIVMLWPGKMPAAGLVTAKRTAGSAGRKKT